MSQTEGTVKQLPVSSSDRGAGSRWSCCAPDS